MNELGLWAQFMDRGLNGVNMQALMPGGEGGGGVEILQAVFSGAPNSVPIPAKKRKK